MGHTFNNFVADSLQKKRLHFHLRPIFRSTAAESSLKTGLHFHLSPILRLNLKKVFTVKISRD